LENPVAMNVFVKSMNFLRSYTMRAPMWLRLTVVGIAFAIPGYWAFTDTGLYHVITAWQLGAMGDQYSPVLSYMLSALFCLLPGLAVMMVLGTFFPEKHPDETKMGRGL
jgi:hypothetical protein